MAKNRDVWFVYILRCTHDVLYVGIAKNVKARFARHKSSKGAKFTQRNKPIEIVWTERHPSRSAALKRESQIKKWRRPQKQALFSGII